MEEVIFAAPVINWIPLIPLILVLGGGVIGVLIEAFAPAKHRRVINIVWTLLVLAAAFVFSAMEWVIALADPSVVGEYVDDTLSVAMQAMIILLGLLAVLVMADRSERLDGAFAAQPSTKNKQSKNVYKKIFGLKCKAKCIS